MERYTAITSKLGVWVGTVVCPTREAARVAAAAAIESGAADSASIWDGYQPVEHLGSGR